MKSNSLIQISYLDIYYTAFYIQNLSHTTLDFFPTTKITLPTHMKQLNIIFLINKNNFTDIFT